MAYTVSQVANSVFGNQRMRVIRVTADAATQNLSTGLGYINFAALTPRSMVAISTLSAGVAIGWKLNANSGSGGTAIAGTLGITNATSGDVVDIIVFGTDL